MVNDSKLKLSDILTQFQEARSGQVKTAEEAPVEEPVEGQMEETQPTEMEAQEPEQNEEGEQEVAEEPSEQVKEGEESESIADTLQGMADRYIAHNQEAIQKEAELFGQYFAESACATMQKTAELSDLSASTYNAVMASLMPEQDMEKEAEDYTGLVTDAYSYTMDMLSKEAEEEEYEELDGFSEDELDKFAELYEDAYTLTLKKVAADEAYNAAMAQQAQPVDEQDVDAAQAVAPEADEEPEVDAVPVEEDNGDDVKSDVAAAILESARAARQAASAASDLAGKIESPDAESAQQDAYNEAMQQIADAQQEGQAAPADANGEPAPVLQDVTNNAYDTAMQQVQQQG